MNSPISSSVTPYTGAESRKLIPASSTAFRTRPALARSRWAGYPEPAPRSAIAPYPRRLTDRPVAPSVLRCNSPNTLSPHVVDHFTSCWETYRSVSPDRKGSVPDAFECPLIGTAKELGCGEL